MLQDLDVPFLKRGGKIIMLRDGKIITKLPLATLIWPCKLSFSMSSLIMSGNADVAEYNESTKPFYCRHLLIIIYKCVQCAAQKYSG